MQQQMHPQVVLFRLVERRCLACRQLFPRQRLIRIIHVRQSNQVAVFFPEEPQKKLMGRSAYLCDDTSCLSVALKGKKIQKSLKTNIPDAIFKYLQERLKRLKGA